MNKETNIKQLNLEDTQHTASNFFCLSSKAACLLSISCVQMQMKIIKHDYSFTVHLLYVGENQYILSNTND